MKNTILTLATLAALSSGQMGDLGNMINDAEHAVGNAVYSMASDAVGGVHGYAKGQKGGYTKSASTNTVYAKVNTYNVSVTPYNVSSVKFSSSKGGFGSANSFGFLIANPE